MTVGRARAVLRAVVVMLAGVVGACLGASVEPHVLGGSSVASPAEFPWFGYLRVSTADGKAYSTQPQLYEPRLVVTAAHCLVADAPVRKVVVYLGAHEADEGQFPDPDWRGVEGVEWYIHPMYGRGSSFRSDVAVIRLRESMSVRPAQLATAAYRWRDVAPESDLTIIGFGRMSDSPGLAPTLQRGLVPKVATTECRELWVSRSSPSGSNYGKVVLEDICAGDHRDGEGDCVGCQSTCKGDSGGPLFHTAGQMAASGFEWPAGAGSGPAMVYGITSRGSTSCSRPHAPSVFTSLSHPDVSTFLDSLEGGIIEFPPLAPDRDSERSSAAVSQPWRLCCTVAVLAVQLL